MSWIVWGRSRRKSSWISATFSGVVQLLGLPCVRHSQLMCDRSWTGHAIETPVHNSSFCPEDWLNHFDGLRSTFPKTGTKFDAHSLFLSLIHRENRHRSRTRLQTKACENCPVHPPMCNLAHCLIRHGSPTVYRCFALPQLLYRWWHYFGKFWIPPRRWEFCLGRGHLCPVTPDPCLWPNVILQILPQWYLL